MTENTTPIPDTDQTRARREHLDRIQELTGNAYPNKFSRSRVVAKRRGASGDTSPQLEDTITALVTCEEITRHVPQLEAGATRPTPEQLEAANAALREFGDVRVSGRLAVPPRVMGKAAFVHLSDGKERLQIYVRRDDVQKMNHAGRTLDGWELFSLLDHGDFIGVEGFLFVTKTGELSVHVRSFEFLAKALLPMPDKVHGITDPEIGRRYRYVDLIASSLKHEREEGELTTREVFERRSKLITQMRAFLDAHGYVEVETPMLTPIASGAAARPFKTHHNALDIDLYARIAPELYLKRLLVGGFERVYELNRNFRNEGIGYRWNPEFTMLEFYCAYMDVNGMMDFCEEMLRTTIKEVVGRTVLQRNIDTVIYRLFGLEEPSDVIEINFERKFKRVSMREIICEYWNGYAVSLFSEAFSIGDISPTWLENIDNVGLLVSATKILLVSIPFETKVSFLRPKADVSSDELASFYEKKDEIERVRRIILSERPSLQDEIQVCKAIEFLFEELVEGYLTEPTFIIDYPKIISPLSKASPDDPTIAERFELFAAGMEIANGFSELNDPVEQFERFKDQQVQRERGDDEAMQMDTDYVRALAYGMPPAAGIGIGIDRLVMLLTNRRSIRDVILFPHMRPAAAPKPEEASEEDAPAESNDENEQAESNDEQKNAQA
jgi:lysyl-tRNA synthetase class 2